MKIRNCLIQGASLLFFCLFCCQPLFAQETGKVNFQSQTQKLDSRGKALHMEGDAVLRSDSMELRARNITVHSGSGEGGKNFSGRNVEKLLAKDDVRILQEGILSEGFEAIYTSAKDELLVRGAPAKVSGTDFQATGAEILYGLTRETIDIRGSKEKPSSFYHGNNGSPITIHSTSQNWNMKKEEVLFSGNIRAKTDTHTLEAEKLLVEYHRNEEGGAARTAETGRDNIVMDRVTATGKVRITEAQGTGRGDKAVFTGNNETIILTGNPAEVNYKGHIIRGPQIRMNQKTGEMEVSGGASGRILPRGKK